MKINYDEVMRFIEFKRKVNKLNIEDIEWIRDNGETVEVDPLFIREWKFVGLNNIDFADIIVKGLIDGRKEELMKEFEFEDIADENTLKVWTETMKVIYSDDLAPKEVVEGSIFLAGPTPRDAETPSWRPEALKILKEIGFKGTVFVPERKTRTKDYDYNTQVEWEWDSLHNADVIVFWVPRELDKMPGFTTNVEFGFYLCEGDALVLYGRPDWAAKKGYLDWLYKKVSDNKIYTSLEEMLKKAKWAVQDQ